MGKEIIRPHCHPAQAIELRADTLGSLANLVIELLPSSPEAYTEAGPASPLYGARAAAARAALRLLTLHLLIARMTSDSTVNACTWSFESPLCAQVCTTSIQQLRHRLLMLAVDQITSPDGKAAAAAAAALDALRTEAIAALIVGAPTFFVRDGALMHVPRALAFESNRMSTQMGSSSV